MVFCYYAHSADMDLWTRLWGRYHVPQNVFLVHQETNLVATKRKGKSNKFKSRKKHTQIRNKSLSVIAWTHTHTHTHRRLTALPGLQSGQWKLVEIRTAHFSRWISRKTLKAFRTIIMKSNGSSQKYFTFPQTEIWLATNCKSRCIIIVCALILLTVDPVLWNHAAQFQILTVHFVHESV